MDGVTVVNTIQGFYGYGKGITAEVVIFSIFTVIFAIVSLFAFYRLITTQDFGTYGFLFMISFAMCVTAIAGALSLYHKKPIYGPQQVVIVDDDVDFNEFMNKYKIIKQEGQLYTIMEK